jgi:hypothetical protein
MKKEERKRVGRRRKRIGRGRGRKRLKGRIRTISVKAFIFWVHFVPYISHVISVTL